MQSETQILLRGRLLACAIHFSWFGRRARHLKREFKSGHDDDGKPTIATHACTPREKLSTTAREHDFRRCLPGPFAHPV